MSCPLSVCLSVCPLTFRVHSITLITSSVLQLFCTIGYNQLLLQFMKDSFHFCLACEAEARHMYCFSGVVVVVVGGGGCGGGVNFLCLGHFLGNYKG